MSTDVDTDASICISFLINNIPQGSSYVLASSVHTCLVFGFLFVFFFYSVTVIKLKVENTDFGSAQTDAFVAIF